MYDEMTAMIVRENARLRAQVAELRAAQTPRPMAEAPRDEWILLCYADGSRNKSRAWKGRAGAWIEEDGIGTDAKGAIGWLPLPPAPTEDKP